MAFSVAPELAPTLPPVLAFALIGALGVGSQWLAWRLRLPSIVLMLLAGLCVGPGLNLLDPSAQFGDLLGPMIGIAVAIILFEGGLTLNIHSLRGAATGVRRLVVIGAPLGWLASALTLHYVAGLSWAASAVFGGIMIVTGPTVIAPLLRQAKLQKRPAMLLQWEAIVNDPIGALAAVLAFEVVIVYEAATSMGHAVQELVIGIAVATALGCVGGWGITRAFRGGFVPEFMKVPALFVALLGMFALSDARLHESGLLAVTIMGIWIANAELPSYAELRRFKEHATILLVSGVFILLAASMSREALLSLDLQALLFVLAVILLARPLPVLVALAHSDIPWRERLLVAFTGPRGVVLVAVAGLFGNRLVEAGIEDAVRIGPLAFALVAATVVLHGFSLAPLSRLLGLTAASQAGVMIIGGSPWSCALAKALASMGLNVMISDPNHAHLRAPREAGLKTFFGDILSKAAEERLDLIAYDTIICAADNDAYNTFVATDLAPEFGRENIFQLKRSRSESTRHALPATLGGRALGADLSYYESNTRIQNGWSFRVTGLTEEFTYDQWKGMHPEAIVIALKAPNGTVSFLGPNGTAQTTDESEILAFTPPRKAV